MKKVALSLGFAAAALVSLSACDKEPEYSPNVEVDEPCEETGACEPTD